MVHQELRNIVLLHGGETMQRAVAKNKTLLEHMRTPKALKEAEVHCVPADSLSCPLTHPNTRFSSPLPHPPAPLERHMARRRKFSSRTQ